MKKTIVWALGALVFFSLLTFMVQREMSQISTVDNLIKGLKKDHYNFVAFNAANLVKDNLSIGATFWTKEKVSKEIINFAKTDIFLLQFNSNGNLINVWDKYGDFGVAWSGLKKDDSMRSASEDEELTIFQKSIPQEYNYLVANAWDVLLSYLWQLTLIVVISFLPALLLLKFTFVVMFLIICFVATILFKNVSTTNKLKSSTVTYLVTVDSPPDSKCGSSPDLVDDYFEITDLGFVIENEITQLFYYFLLWRIKSFYQKIDHIPNFVLSSYFLIKKNSKLKLIEYEKQCTWLFRPNTQQFTRTLDGNSRRLSPELCLLSCF